MRVTNSKLFLLSSALAMGVLLCGNAFAQKLPDHPWGGEMKAMPSMGDENGWGDPDQLEPAQIITSIRPVQIKIPTSPAHPVQNDPPWVGIDWCAVYANAPVGSNLAWVSLARCMGGYVVLSAAEERELMRQVRKLLHSQ